MAELPCANIGPGKRLVPGASGSLRPAAELSLVGNNLAELLANPIFTTLLEAGSDGAIVIEAQSRRIAWMNRRARALLGYVESEELSCQCREAMGSSACGAACPLPSLLQGLPVSPSLRLFYRGREGKERLHAETRFVVVRRPDGEPLAAIELFRDLSAEVAFEKALGERYSLHEIIGRSPPMQRLYELVEQVAPYELPVLITGESGVGKERFADAIQTLSDRAQAPYVKVNCGALSPGLIESELFGHKKGAFTGATQDRKGRVEEATGGTLLLDEIGELPLSLQVKLLRTLQQGEVQRLGEDRPRQVDVRVIAATNRDIESDVANGHFREDLYYRLAGVRLHVPPLRERRLDIPLLAAHFLERFGEESARRGRPKRVGALLPEAEADLVAREWRGNVRELENVLRLAWIRVPPDASIDREALAGQGPPPREPTPVSLADAEDVAIRKAMERSGGNVAAAARLLGIDRTTLWRKLKKGSGY